MDEHSHDLFEGPLLEMNSGIVTARHTDADLSQQLIVLIASGSVYRCLITSTGSVQLSEQQRKQHPGQKL